MHFLHDSLLPMELKGHYTDQDFSLNKWHGNDFRKESSTNLEKKIKIFLQDLMLNQKKNL